MAEPEHHEHGSSFANVVDAVVTVAAVAIVCVAVDWLITELRARKAVATADLLAAQASVANATTANAAARAEVIEHEPEPAADEPEAVLVDEPAPAAPRPRRTTSRTPTTPQEEP